MGTYVDISVTDRDGNIVGGGTRAIRPAQFASVDHAGFALEPGFQGQGFMARYNQQAEQSYRDNGIQQINIHASGGTTTGAHSSQGAPGTQLVGGYAWARAGYDFAHAGARGDVHQSATRLGSKYSPEVRAAITRIGQDPHSTPLDYAMIGWSPGAKTWPGKEIMLASSWDGVKRL
jgi:hypothetical protein